MIASFMSCQVKFFYNKTSALGTAGIVHISGWPGYLTMAHGITQEPEVTADLPNAPNYIFFIDKETTPSDGATDLDKVLFVQKLANIQTVGGSTWSSSHAQWEIPPHGLHYRDGLWAVLSSTVEDITLAQFSVTYPWALVGQVIELQSPSLEQQ